MPSTVARLYNFASVFGLMLNSRLSSESEPYDDSYHLWATALMM